MARKPKPPVRLQLSRQKGFDLAKLSRKTNGLACVKVDRSTEWGNHYQVLFEGLGRFSIGGKGDYGSREAATAEAVRLHAADCAGKEDRIRAALAGVNLACWCEPGTPCHADTYLRIANDDRPESVS